MTMRHANELHASVIDHEGLLVISPFVGYVAILVACSIFHQPVSTCEPDVELPDSMNGVMGGGV